MHRREQLRALEEDLGYLFDDAELLDLALIHKSYANEEGIPDQHNERLEFLGDSVLDLAVAGVLYELEPQLNEGDMTRVRAFLVKEDTLARAARALDLGGCILLGKGEQQSGGEDKSSILANAFEALVGAVYLDGGFGLAYNLVESIFAPVIDEGGTSVIARDYKTRLQEYCQARYKKAPTYRQVESTGPDHNRVFVVEVLVDKRCLERGRGHSKKEAEQNAARHALEILE
jgi:ribonuclease-3